MAAGADGGIAPSSMLRAFLPHGRWPTCLLPEIEFSHVPMQMLLRAMLIDALHAPLEDAEVSFNGICVDRAATVLTSGVAHEIVLGELTA